MTKLNDAKLHLFYTASDKFKNLSKSLMNIAQETDKKSKPEFNAIAVPGLLPHSTPAEHDVQLERILFYDINIATKGAYLVNKTEKSFEQTQNVKYGSKILPFVIGNFNISKEFFESIDPVTFNNSDNIVLLSKDGYALEELSHSADGLFFNDKKKKYIELDEILFEPLFGKSMKNPLIVTTRDNNIFMYKSPNVIRKELEMPNLLNNKYVGTRLSSFLHKLGNVGDNIFKYNTVKSLDLNTNIVSKTK